MTQHPRDQIRDAKRDARAVIGAAVAGGDEAVFDLLQQLDPEIADVLDRRALLVLAMSMWSRGLVEIAAEARGKTPAEILLLLDRAQSEREAEG